MNWKDFEIQIKTFYGLEEVLAQEIKHLGGSEVEIRNRAVACRGDLMFLYKLNYSLRTALKIIVPVAQFTARNEDELYYRAIRVEWENYISSEDSFHIDFTIFSEHFNHSQFAMLKVKDAIVDRLKKVYGKRPNISTDEKALKLNLHIQNHKVTLSLDSSGEPLYKRGYRVETGPAPMNEVLAAGLIALSGWQAGAHLLDPMCGSGTLAIEAALYAYNVPSQLHRDYFGFMNWKNYEAEAWEKIKEIRIAKMKEFPYTITASDEDSTAIEMTRINAEKADVLDFLTLKNQDFFESHKEHSPLYIIMNPPYNERIPIEESFYKKIGDTLKHHYPNTKLWIISSDLRIDKKIGLKPSRKIKLFNGKLECKFLEYESYEGSRKKHLINKS